MQLIGHRVLFINLQECSQVLSQNLVDAFLCSYSLLQSVLHVMAYDRSSRLIGQLWAKNTVQQVLKIDCIVEL